MLPVEQPFKTYTGLDGKPLDNGYVYFGQPDQDPIAHPVTVYWDADGTLPAAQPLRTVNGYIVNDSNAPANVFYDSAYSETVIDSKGRQVFYAPTSDEFSIASYVAGLAKSTGASLIGYVQAGIGAVKRQLSSKLAEMVSVKDFGAVGDGVTDDTAALQAAASSLASGQALYFPAGTYIVDSGCVSFYNKQRIRVYGDGKATVVRPSVQQVAAVKQDYPSTMQFDQCSYVTLHDMVIESKGESYGNIDAYGGLAGGDPRAQAIGQYGGSALVVSRSDNVTLENIDARRCGSCGVVYLSSCQDLVAINCFANARSLGYAGFAVDNWADSTANLKRTYKFVACRVAKEDADCAAKAGIASEGDQDTGRLINLEVVGGTLEDCQTGANALALGAGISCYETRLTMNGVSVKNCYIGVAWQKRGGAVDKSWCRVSGCAFDACNVTGAYIAIGTATGGADVSFIGVRMDIQPASYWATQADQTVNVSSGITVAGYTNGEINIVGCRINGGQYGVWAVDSATFNISGSDIAGSVAAIWTYGGGILKATGNRLRVTAGDRAIGRNTGNLAATASYNLYTYATGNLLECVNDTVNDYGLALGGNPVLFSETQVARNALPKGIISAPIGSATLYDVDTPFVWTPVIKGDGVAGTYEIDAGSTRCTVTKTGSIVTVNAYIVLAAAITGGGTGDLTISGLPFPKRDGSGAYGTGLFSGVGYGTGTAVNSYFGTTAASSSIYFWQTANNSAVTLTQISGVSAGDTIAFSITYETDQ